MTFQCSAPLCRLLQRLHKLTCTCDHEPVLRAQFADGGTILIMYQNSEAPLLLLNTLFFIFPARVTQSSVSEAFGSLELKPYSLLSEMDL